MTLEIREVAQRVFGDRFVTCFAEDQADRRPVILVAHLFINGRQVEIHLARELGLERLDLQIDHDEAPQLQVVEQQVEEILLAGPLEVGLTRAGSCTLEGVVQPLPGNLGAAPLTAGEVVIVSGGARGVTAEVAVALAAAFQPTIQPGFFRRLTFTFSIGPDF